MEKINIAKLLKNCPIGMELDCTMFDNVTLLCVDNSEGIIYPIIVLREDGNSITLTKYGQCSDANSAKCVIFPKGKTTWEGFQNPFKDGDVVVAEDDKLFQLFLLKHLTHSEDDNSYDGYCYFGWDFQRNELFEKGKWGFNRLATEEEKSKLFQAIKDNGYKWNEETKTLEKLPKFKVGDRLILKDNQFNIPSIKIKAVTKSQYILENEGFFYISSADEKYVLEDKFDITNLKPFDKVLVRDTNGQVWTADLFSHIIDTNPNLRTTFVCAGHYSNQCIPYEGNEHLLGKSDDCNEYFKTW